MENFKRYNWVDIKDFAEVVFSEYEYTLAVAEDMWNLLMFRNEVPQTSIAKSTLTAYEKGDMIVWLLAIYDIIFDFQCIVGQENHYMDHDVGLCDYATYNLKNYCEKLDYFVSNEDEEDRYSYLSEYMMKPSLKLLNKKMKVQSVPKVPFYNIDDNILNFEYSGKTYDSHETDYNHMENYAIAYEALEIEVIKRSQHIASVVFDYFDGNTTKMLYLMTGYHYRDFYTDYKQRKKKLINERDEKIKELLKRSKSEWFINEHGTPARIESDEEVDVIECYEEEIKDLDGDYPLFITNLDEIINDVTDENFELLLSAYNWIENEIN